MLILCDFDGTITEEDITDLVWDPRVPPAERARMNEDVLAGRIRMQEYIGRGYAFVHDSPAALLDELRKTVRIRRGFHTFYEKLVERDIPFHVVSNGLDFYMRAFLPASVRLACFVARFEGGAYRVDLPPGVALAPGEEFKVNRVKHLRRLHRGPCVFVGDGRADFEPARLCDRVFAVEGSRLSQLCREANTPAVEFRTFDDVATQLEL